MNKTKTLRRRKEERAWSNVKWPQTGHACLGFLVQISCGGREDTNSSSESWKPFNCKWTGICNWTWPFKILWPFRSKMENKRKTMSVFWPPLPRSWKYGVIESLVVGYHPYETCLWFQDWRLFLCLPIFAHPQLEIDLKVSFWPYILPVTWWKWGEAKYSHVIAINKNNFKLNVNSEYVVSAWRLVWTCTNIF